ncbi:MAG: YdcF family protein [Rhodospirillales bacterium]
MARRSRRGATVGVGRLLLMVFVILGIWAIGLFQFAETIPKKVEDPGTRTDAIVVLTGGTGRLDEGLDLLARDLAEKLFVSGVYYGVDVERLIHISRREPEGLKPRIGIGNAVNTVGNAAETRVWMEQNGFVSLRLVTGAYHMPRSMAEFHFFMPTVQIVPNPVFPEHVKQEYWWAWPGTASLIVSEYNKWLFARGRHWISTLFAPPRKALNKNP